VLAAFASIAILMAAIGIHGLLAFSVSQRVREIAVRMALGATARDIIGLVGSHALVLAAVGILVGVACAYPLGRAMQALLAGVSPADVVSFATAIGVTLVMTLAGSLLPALRAIRVNPIVAMRTE
jgi:ABC-type antimicrobial peptide transport system permease subunit